MRCRKRDPRSARIALIVDSYGGSRVIVSQRKSIAHHVRQGEMVHIVPKLFVHEPIAWNDIPMVVDRAELEFEKWLSTRPNLTAQDQNVVTLYRLRRLRHPDSKGSVNLLDIVET